MWWVPVWGRNGNMKKKVDSLSLIVTVQWKFLLLYCIEYNIICKLLTIAPLPAPTPRKGGVSIDLKGIFLNDILLIFCLLCANR